MMNEAKMATLKALNVSRSILMLTRCIPFVLGVVLLFPQELTAQVVDYYHVDGLGSVRAVTNAAGELVERHDYLPYGGELNEQPSPQPLRFTGKERDTETGLDYFGARYYGFTISRFTTVDPAMTIEANLLDPQRWNRYAYARNNPYRYVDPDGRVLRTTQLQRMQEIAGSAASKVSINASGVLDVSALTASDRAGNEGALLLHQLATSKHVYTYDESNFVQTLGGPQELEGTSVINLDVNPDARYKYRGGKLATDLPISGVDAAIAIRPNGSWYEKSGRLVPRYRIAFHELAEAYEKIERGREYNGPRGTGFGGAHWWAGKRENTLMRERPDNLGRAGGKGLEWRR